MENPEEVLQSLDEFAKMKPKDIPRELEEYLCYVAKTGDPVYQWSLVKCLFREKLLNVITDFYESCPTIDLPPCPNVDSFNYEIMKRNLLERLDSFVNAPFTVQRLCELLTTPRKEYSRVDKFMRAIEKNILVVSTREPGNARRSDVMQPDFLMNGVMDGRGIDIGEAIETVSSDGVNLMHSDDAEVNISDSDTIRIDCAGAEEIDMDDHPDVETSADVWDKERDAATSGDEECVKEYEGNEESDAENEPKINSEAEVDNLKDVESESKEPDSPDLESEGFGETVESEQHDSNVDSTTSEPNVTVSQEDSESIPEVGDEIKSDVEEKVIPEVEDGPADSVSECSTDNSKDDSADDDALKAKPPEEEEDEEEDVVSESQVENTVAKSSPESSDVSEVEENAEEDSQKSKDSVIVEDTKVCESVTDVDDVSPLESLEEVASNISTAPISEGDVSTTEHATGDDVTETCKPEPSEKNEPEVTKEEPEASTVSNEAESESQEQMEVEVEEVGQDTPVVRDEEPMDQTEQIASAS